MKENKVKKSLLGIAVASTMALGVANNLSNEAISSQSPDTANKIEAKMSLGFSIYGSYYADSGDARSYANVANVFGGMALVAGVMPGGQIAGAVLGA